MTNALWWVRFKVHFKDNHDITELVTLSAPDYKDTKKAKTNAKSIAKDRLAKKLDKQYGTYAKGAKLVCTEVLCVG